jgi:hypothetical protein
MSKLLARIMLAIFMLPSAGMVMSIAYVVTYHQRRSFWVSHYRGDAWLVSGACTWLFIAGYWILLWRKAVRWTSERRWLTLFSAGVAAICGAIGGLATKFVDDDFGIFVFICVTILAWLPLTVWIWRDTATERAERSGGNDSALSCPTCGYNLTGLSTARCPECGSTFTLDELVRRQPPRDQAELQV